MGFSFADCTWSEPWNSVFSVRLTLQSPYWASEMKRTMVNLINSSHRSPAVGKPNEVIMHAYEILRPRQAKIGFIIFIFFDT